MLLQNALAQAGRPEPAGAAAEPSAAPKKSNGAATPTAPSAQESTRCDGRTLFLRQIRLLQARAPAPPPPAASS